MLVVVCDGRWLSDGSGVCREMTRANLGLFTLWGVYEELTRVLGRLTKVTADFTVKDNQSRVESRYVFWSQISTGLTGWIANRHFTGLDRHYGQILS